jgi:glucokinase-like ROK family protein
LLLYAVERLRGGLIVSCQANAPDVLYGSQSMALMASAAEAGGAVGIRANGPADVAAIRQVVRLPIIGIYKQDLPGYGIRITPNLDAARAVVAAGADIVALDATRRGPEEGRLPATELIRQVKTTLNVPVMADISTFEEGVAAAEAGADIVASTLSGYTAYSPMQEVPDFDLVARLVQAVPVPVIAEGRIATPQDAQRMVGLGCLAVVVGSMITRPRWIVEHYVAALRAEQQRLARVVGVDIGGTKIATGIIDYPTQVVDSRELPTLAQEGGSAVLARTISAVDALLKSHEGVRAIGISASGEVDTQGRIVYATGFMPGWQGIALREAVEARFGLPTVVENDGQAATLAEAIHGAGQDYESVLGVTAGTGVGGGFVIDRQIYAGATHASLALGHIAVEKNGRQCTCGRRGCLESYVSGPALVADYNAHVAANRHASTGEQIARSAQQGDEDAIAAIDRMGEWLGYGLGIVLNLLNPAVVVVGGGVTQIGDLFLNSVRGALKHYAYSTVSEVPLLAAQLGPNAGLIGAAALARQLLVTRKNQ